MSDPLTFESQVFGDAEIKARFKNMHGAVRERFRSTLRDLGMLVRDRARALAPMGTKPKKKPYRLRPSINAKLFENEGGMVEVIGRPVFYGRFLEEGLDTSRQPRRQRGVVGVRTVMTKTGAVMVKPRMGLVQLRSRTHRFRLPKHPFMRPAWESTRAQIKDDLQHALNDSAEML
jgi:HK97 gp10 family phage protein